MRTTALSILMTCASVGAIIIEEGEEISEGRYCDITKGGFGICEKKENCAVGDAVLGEKCNSSLVCCPLQGTKIRTKCAEYSKIESSSTCPQRDNQAAKLEEFPHMAAIGYNSVRNNKWLCGGVLISERFVLTVASCSTDSKVGPPRRVRLGDLKITDREVSHVQQVTVIEVIVHPNYTNSNKINDIALLKLSTDLKLSSYVRPACLYMHTELPSATGVALGWGRTTTSNQPDELLKVKLPFVSNKMCQDAYRKIGKGEVINSMSMVCAGDRGKDTCNGDSGGPLQVTNSGPNYMATIIGITSFGSNPCGLDIPGVYTRISYFVNWIESVVWP